MAEPIYRALHASAGMQPSASLNTFQFRVLSLGLLAAVIVTIMAGSLLAGFSFVALALVMGLVWRRDGVQVLPFVFGYQWLQIVAGLFFDLAYGYFPGAPEVVGPEKAVLLSLLGLVVLALGVRLGDYLLPQLLPGFAKTGEPPRACYNVHLLFWLIIFFHAVNWIVEIDPRALFFQGSQIIYGLLAFGSLLAFLLFLAIFRQRRGYYYLPLALVFVTVPGFTVGSSAFIGPLTLLLLALLGTMHHQSDQAGPVPKLPVLLSGAAVSVVLIVMALAWQGGVKGSWRAHLRASAEKSQGQRISEFFPVVGEVVPRLEWASAFESAAGRLSSGIGFFALVLDRVPGTIPYENGALTMRALEHILKPRILFPDKENLGSDSWLVRKYAGANVAGEEMGTSVGLGYMAEFYIDFGFPGMVVPLLFYGCLITLVVQTIQQFSLSYDFFAAGATAVLSGLNSLDGNAAKMWGGMLSTTIVFCVLLHFCGGWLHRLLSHSSWTRLTFSSPRRHAGHAVSPGR